MLKKIVFAAALVVGFVTSFNVARTGRATMEVVSPIQACDHPVCGGTTGGKWPG
jgi:hypothetical protein